MLAGSVMWVLSRVILLQNDSNPTEQRLDKLPDPPEVPNVGSLGSFGALAWEATRGRSLVSGLLMLSSKRGATAARGKEISNQFDHSFASVLNTVHPCW